MFSLKHTPASVNDNIFMKVVFWAITENIKSAIFVSTKHKAAIETQNDLSFEVKVQLSIFMMRRVSMHYFEQQWPTVFCLHSIILSMHSLNWPELWFFCVCFILLRNHSSNKLIIFSWLDSPYSVLDSWYSILTGIKFRETSRGLRL